ncbi:MAG TPA: hypothetical protein DCG75_01780 [Bacteroidales bacterium]|nr:hypothetical protein [Bacteroidales bacterium]
MNLNVFEKFILLSLDSKKGKFLIDTMSLNYGIAGAILMELSELNKINIERKKLILVDSKLTKNQVIDGCIKLIYNSKKNRRIKYWINKIGNNSTGFKKQILNELKLKGIIKIEKNSFLWGLINIYRYPILNTKPVDEQTSKLRKIVLENEKPDLESILLLSLMNSCKLTRILFINKKENRAANKIIKELTQNIEISNTVSQALKEIQTAVLVATTSAFIGSSSN